MDDHLQFLEERTKRVAAYKSNESLQQKSRDLLLASMDEEYSYNFSWMGLPVIQYPQDLIALQEIIFETKPDIIIETGVARGGSLVFFASMLELLGGDGKVIGIDIDIRSHNRKRIEDFPLYHRIELVEGSSVDEEVVLSVQEFVGSGKRVMVSLDSNHTHAHVLEELRLYSPLVSDGCYCVVFDTVVEDLPAGSSPNRPWDKGNNPKTAVWEFLKCNKDFEIDYTIEDKLLLTAAPDGYLKCIR